LPVTIHEVAKRAGVGIGTVSSVLNNSRPVNETTRQKVLAAVKDLAFVPNPSARRLSLGKTHTIAVIIPYFTIASQIERLRGVMSVIAESDYDISLFAVETIPQRNKVLQTVPHRGGVDGLLIFSLNLSNEEVRRIRQANIPTVLVETVHPHLPYIFVDNIAAAQMAVSYLIDLGHQKIAYLSDHRQDLFDSGFDRSRYLGYCQALEMAGIPIRPEYYRQAGSTLEAHQRMIQELLTLPDSPTAIFAFSDEIALEVLEVARQLNLTVPGDLSVVGYDDVEVARFAQLTTVHQCLFESGLQGVEVLLDAIDNLENHQTNGSLPQLQLPTELVIRGSTGRPIQR
jgi:DNA-binding LacI/PurR family transcriptional regulator